jgi:hypothetical protein
VKPRRRVHPLVEIGLLRVNVTVEMDDPELAVEVLRHPPRRRKPDRMIPAQHRRERPCRENVADAFGDLVERLFDIAGDREDVAEIGDRDRLPQIDAELEAVRPVQR